MLRSSLLIFAIAIAGNFPFTVCKKLPSYFEKCKLDVGINDDCFKRNVEIVKPHLINGIPEMRIPPVEPLRVPLVEIRLNNYNSSLRDINIYNASIFDVSNIKNDLPHNKLQMEVHFPFLRIESKYKSNGKILLLELQGNGDAYTNISDVTGFVDMQGERYQKNGKTYLDFNKNKLSLKVGPIQSYFTNLFAGNEELTASTNKIINENSREFFQELQPVLEETVAAFVFGIINNVFKSYSLEELFIF